MRARAESENSEADPEDPQPQGATSADAFASRSGDPLALATAPAYALLLVAACPLIFWGIGRYGVVGADEAFYQDIAINMLESGNWYRLQSGSYQYIYDTFANAPLQYWLRGLVVSFFGETHLSMRLLSSVCALLAVFATHRLVLLVADRRAALLAALLLLTNFQFLYLHCARTGELEPIVCLLLVLIAHAFIRAIQDPGRSWLGHHVCLALLFNVKAPVIPIPLLAEALCLLVIPLARRRALGWLKLGVLMLPFAATWHIAQAIQHREALATLLESVRYQASGSFVKGAAGTLAGRSVYYANVLLFGAFPSLLLVPPGALSLVGSSVAGSGADPRTLAARRVLVIFPLATLGYYLAISKIGPWYVIHAYPFLAAWCGVWLSRVRRGDLGLVSVVLLSLALSLLLWLQPDMQGLSPFAEDAIRFPMKMRWREVSGLAPLAGVCALAAFALAGLLAARRRWPRSFAGALATALALCFVTAAAWRSTLPLAAVDHLSPIAALAADLEARRAAGRAIPYPIELPPAHPWVVNYYFWRDHQLRLVPGGADPRNPSATRYLLVAERRR
jgi:4-amino-4-deoxy-L-arabinose transferase-like glycosyltransferase